jgi:type VI secretion system protein ImpA
MSIDVQSLTHPIAHDAPCGEDLTYSAEFDSIQESRREDDPTLDQGEWVTPLKEADWLKVVELTSDLLQHRAKDLRLAVWLTEALTKTQGLNGLNTGLIITDQLIELFWDNLHPLSDSGDHEQRIGSLIWLVNTAANLLRRIPLTDAESGRFTLLDYETALASNQSLAANESADAGTGGRESTSTLALFKRAQQDTPPEFLSHLLTAIEACKATVSRFANTLDEKLGQEGPSFTRLLETLRSMEMLTQRLTESMGINTLAVEPDSFGRPVTSESTSIRLDVNNIRSRTEALHMLRAVARFFRATEPHSPVAYLATKAANWGEMPLHAWLKAVIKDDGTLSHVEELLGIDSNEHAPASGEDDS